MPIRKLENTHKSSSFQSFKDSIIKKHNLSPVCQDLDLIKLNNNKIERIIEVKSGKWINAKWKPFIQNNFPSMNENRLDDINYMSLKKFCELLEVNCMIYRYKRDDLIKGMSIYKVLDKELNYHYYGNVLLEDFVKKTVGKVSTKNEMRHKIKFVKDHNNPNISYNNNLYKYIHDHNYLSKYYYIERDGVWSMLISNEKTLNPLWLYIEINENITDILKENYDLKIEFFPQIEIANSLNIPLSIISYSNDIENITTIDFDIKKNSFKTTQVYKKTEDNVGFEEYYINNIVN